MDITIDDAGMRTAHRLMTSLVVPRPIALVTTRNANGTVNTAPFSFFNCMCADPPTMAFGTGWRGERLEKDTSRNIRREQEFVINLVDEQLVEQMNICAIDFQSELEEHVEARLQLVDSKVISPPRIASAPASFECTALTSVEIGQGCYVHIGSVKHIHIRDGLINPETMRVDTDHLGLVGRMHGPGWYARTTDRFQHKQITVEQWLDQADQ
jgi:flavin reductase (DIM6/NTAB) family NADH-FMN oxidoreductase RutF